MTKLKMREAFKVLNLPIRVDLVEESLWVYKCTYPMIPNSITVHNAYFGGTVEQLHQYGLTCCLDPNLQMLKSWHFSVGPYLVIQSLPLNRNSWQSGDGNGPGNRESISMESCPDIPIDSPLYPIVEKNMEKTCAILCYRYGWSTNRIFMHYHRSGKYCPHQILRRNAWQKFLSETQIYINKLNMAEKRKAEAKKKAKQPKPEPKPEPKTYIHRVQTYPLNYHSTMLYKKQQARAAGFVGAYPVIEDGQWRVQLVATNDYSEAVKWAKKAQQRGLNVIIRSVEQKQRQEVRAA